MSRISVAVGGVDSIAEPTPESVTQANIAYHNVLADRYDERDELFHARVTAMYRHIFDRHVFSRFAADDELEALDAGCGTGCMERFLHPRSSRIVAFDASPSMVERARCTYPAVDFRVGDAYDMPLEANRRFDIVCENALLHHLKDYELVLEELARRVRPGGVLFLGYEPNYFAFLGFFWIRALYRKLAPERRVTDIVAERGEDLERLAEYHQFFSRGLCPLRIKRFLRRRGFTKVMTFYRSEHFLGQLRDRLDWNLIEWLPQPLLRLSGPLSLNFHMVAYKGRTPGV